MEYGFSITRTTQTGVLEFLTEKGFRSEKAITIQNLAKLSFSKTEGTKKVLELRNDCRLPALKKSIILNY